MTFNFSVYTLVYLAGSCTALILACLFYSRRPARGAFQLACFGLFCAFWSLGAGLDVAAREPACKIAFTQWVEYPGVIGSCLFWLFFALSYSGSDWLKKTRYLMLLGIIPVIIMVLVVTNDLHHWYWSNIITDFNNPVSALTYQRGPWYWVFVAYCYFMYITGAYILLRFGFKNPRLYRAQLIGVCLGTLIPFLGSLLYLFRMPFFRGLDLAPFSFILAGVVYAFTFFRLGFLDVVPVARGTLVEKMPDGIIVIDADGNIADMNPAAERICAVKRQEGLGNSLAVVNPRLKEILDKAGSAGHLETNAGSPDVKYFLDVNITSLTDKKQKMVGKLLILRDVSARHKIQQDLRESESRYSTLVEQSNEGVLIVQKGVFVFANSTLTELTGYNASDLQGRPVSFLIREPGLQTVENNLPGNKDYLASPRTYEVVITRKDGETRIVDVSEGMIRYGGTEALILSVRDITERKQIQQKLAELYTRERQLRSNLQAEIEKRSKYTRSLVHDLKVPLNAIASSVVDLESRLKRDILLALVKNIGRASFNLDQRIDELIELANGEVGILKIDPLEVDLAVLLREVVSELTPVAAAKGLVMLQDIPDVPTVLGESGRLRQVITNLLSNSIKFTNRGSILVKASCIDDREVMVQVSDTGRGMTADEVENIFDPYRRKLNSNRDLHGLGIGLALSKMLVELHKGRITAQSIPGQGSTFSFTVPVFHQDRPVE